MYNPPATCKSTPSCTANYCSIEMEGGEDASTAMPKSIALLQDAWARATAT